MGEEDLQKLPLYIQYFNIGFAWNRAAFYLNLNAFTLAWFFQERFKLFQSFWEGR